MFPPATSKERFTELWTASNEFLAKLYQSRLATVAALSGECLTSGFCLALTCDKRVAADNARMGFTEVRLGLPVPPLWCNLLSTIVGIRKSEMYTLMGIVLEASGAEAAGIVDEV